MAVTDQAISRIKDMITSGELRPGDRLLPEKELSETLGLSRSSLREAVKALEILRVLDVRRGDGTYVTSLEPHLLLQASSFAVDVRQDASVLEVFEVRRVLEPAAAALAVQHAGEEDVQGLRDLLGRVNADTPVDELVAHDVLFHRTLCGLSGNAYLASLLDMLSTRTVRARVWRGLTETHAVDRSLAEHLAIVDALAAGDIELTRARVLVHVSGVTEWLERDLAPPESE